MKRIAALAALVITMLAVPAAAAMASTSGSGPGYGQPPRLVQVACPLPRQFHKGHFNFKITVKEPQGASARQAGAPTYHLPQYPGQAVHEGLWAAGSPLRHGRGEQHAHRGLRPGPGSAA